MAKVIVPQGDEAKLFRDILRNRSGYRFIEMLDEQAKMMTGFESWAAAGPFWDFPAVDEFRVLVGGQGRIKGEIVTWSGPQSVTLAANRTAYVYIDSTGTIGQATDATVSESTFTDNIVLFEVLYDGTNTLVTKENHPYEFQTDISRYLHNNVGVVIRGLGSQPDRVSAGTGAAAGDREIQIIGADVLEDHGLPTTISDSGGAGVTWNVYYQNGSGQWTRNALQTQIPMLYNNAGTPTAITSGRYAIFRIGISKDSINSSDPLYIAVMGTAEYTNLTTAENAIAAGGIANWSNELSALEIAQLGYVIVQNNVSGGFIEEIDIQKSTFGTRFLGGAGTGDHDLLTNLTNDTHPQYALLAGRVGDVYNVETVQALGAGGLSLKNSVGNEVLLLGDTGIHATFQDSLDVVGILSVNQIDERTSGSGINIDGVLLKDSTVGFNGDPDTYFSNPTGNQIAGIFGGSEGIRLTANGISINRISELTADVGVTIETALIKDGRYGFDGDFDTYIHNPAANEIAILTGGTERVRIDDAGFVGIGTVSPDSELHIQRGTGVTGTASPNASALLTLERGGTAYFQFFGPNDANQGILFGDVDNNSRGGLFYNHATDTLSNIAAGSAIATFDNTNATFNREINAAAGIDVSSGGIEFPTGGAVKDTYQESSYIPRVEGATSGNNATFSGTPSANYTLDGRMCHLDLSATWTDHVDAGEAMVITLPVTPARATPCLFQWNSSPGVSSGYVFQGFVDTTGVIVFREGNLTAGSTFIAYLLKSSTTVQIRLQCSFQHA